MLIRCTTIPVTATPIGAKAESKGVACNTHPFKLLDEKLYAKQEMIPAGSNWSESIVTLYEEFYTGAPDEWREATILAAAGSGGFTHQGSFTPPHHLQDACLIDTTVENEDFAEDQDAFVQRSGGEDWDLRVVKELPGTEEPGTPANYTWQIKYLLTDHNEEYSENTTAPEAPAPDLPDPADWIAAGISISGLQRTLVNFREKASWYWRLVGDSIYSESTWPLDEHGNPVTLTGAVRWTVTEQARSVTDEETGPWEEVSVSYYSEEFSLDQGDEWEGEIHTIDENGGADTEVELAVSLGNVMVKYPAAALVEPDYSAFPYL